MLDAGWVVVIKKRIHISPRHAWTSFNQGVASAYADDCISSAPYFLRNIMVLIGDLSCQVKDVKQVASIYTKLDDLPPYLTKTGPFFQVSEKEGIQAITLYMVKDGRSEEAYDYLIDRYNAFVGVSSVRFSVGRWENFKDALSILREL